MYLHLGQDTVIKTDEVLGIFDLDTATISKYTREYLAQAEKKGRLVVLPCKDWFEIVFGEQELFWGIDTDYIETPIREISVDNAERFTWYDGWKTLVLRGNDENGLDWEFSPEDIGKTVFLTREAAEAALEEREAEHEQTD